MNCSHCVGRTDPFAQFLLLLFPALLWSIDLCLHEPQDQSHHRAESTADTSHTVGAWFSPDRFSIFHLNIIKRTYISTFAAGNTIMPENIWLSCAKERTWIIAAVWGLPCQKIILRFFLLLHRRNHFFGFFQKGWYTRPLLLCWFFLLHTRCFLSRKNIILSYLRSTPHKELDVRYM